MYHHKTLNLSEFTGHRQYFINHIFQATYVERHISDIEFKKNTL